VIYVLPVDVSNGSGELKEVSWVQLREYGVAPILNSVMAYGLPTLVGPDVSCEADTDLGVWSATVELDREL